MRIEGGGILLQYVKNLLSKFAINIPWKQHQSVKYIMLKNHC